MKKLGKFDGILFCTDLDGTLLKNDKTISKENIEAIEFFKSEGGIFTFITGRMPFFVSNIYNAIKPNAPFGCVNGGGLYDFQRKEYIWNCAMSNEVTELIKCIDNNFSDIGIQVNTFFKTYFCKENKTMQKFRERTKLPNLVCDFEEVKEPIAKIIFGSEKEEEISAISQMLQSHPLSNNYSFIRSEKSLYEILPKGIGKGTAVQKLIEYLNIDINRTIAIGDYDNDISMFKVAKMGIAVSNASKNVLEIADYITVSNEENAIARVIFDLDKNILKKGLLPFRCRKLSLQ